MVKHNQFIDELNQVREAIELQWKRFVRRWEQMEQRLLAAVQYYTTINHVSYNDVIHSVMVLFVIYI